MNLNNETHQHALHRFILLILVLSLYAGFVIHKYGLKDGLLVTALTWAFFVFCTPIADAGFLLAFPTRIILGVRMIYTQIAAYVLAAAFVFFAFLVSPHVFDKNILLHLFATILTTPIPYWLILVLSLAGTFASIIFGDELLDVAYHKDRKLYHKHYNRYYVLVMLFIFSFAVLLYVYLLNTLGINIPLL